MASKPKRKMRSSCSSLFICHLSFCGVGLLICRNEDSPFASSARRLRNHLSTWTSPCAEYTVEKTRCRDRKMIRVQTLVLAEKNCSKWHAQTFWLNTANVTVEKPRCVFRRSPGPAAAGNPQRSDVGVLALSARISMNNSRPRAFPRAPPALLEVHALAAANQAAFLRRAAAAYRPRAFRMPFSITICRIAIHGNAPFGLKR